MKTRQLTELEAEVLFLMIAGKSYKQIDEALGHAGSKMTAHRVFDKLGADNRVQAVRFALDMGFRTYSLWPRKWRSSQKMANVDWRED